MANYKSTTARLEIDEAKRLHRCQHNQRHEIRKGSLRLKLIEGRSKEHFCTSCAIQMLTADLDKLQALLVSLQEPAAQA